MWAEAFDLGSREGLVTSGAFVGSPFDMGHVYNIHRYGFRTPILGFQLVLE
jgi:hypothetical protein